MNEKLKKLDLSKDEFTANGTKYFIKNTLTVKRFIEYEKLQNHFGFGLGFQQLHDKLKDSIDLANKGKGVQAWNIIFNLVEGIAHRIDERTHPALLILSLFVVTEGEDLSTWVEKDQTKKFDDWNAEAIDINDFFELAVNLVRGFLPIYNEIIKDISAKIPEKEK